MTKKELEERVNRNSLQIGSRILSHGNHLRIVYFDIEGTYLGDTMSLNVSNSISVTEDPTIPYFKEIKQDMPIHRRMLKFFTSESYDITILGPSMAGKTSLTMFLETGIPERQSQRVNHAATMGKSTKRFTLAGNEVTIYDMGGQRDFWNQWSTSIQSSDKVIFVLDGAANNINEITDALNNLFDHFIGDQQLLILFNKLDLYLDYTNHFLNPQTLFNTIEVPEQIEYWVVKTSIYNGMAYNYEGDQDETPLASVIIDFLSR